MLKLIAISLGVILKSTIEQGVKNARSPRAIIEGDFLKSPKELGVKNYSDFFGGNIGITYRTGY